jgi:hypothetical protein
VHEFGVVRGGATHTARVLRRRTLDGHTIECSYDARARREWVRDSGGSVPAVDIEKCWTAVHPDGAE